MNTPHLVIVFYTGDWRAAYQLLAAGEASHYQTHGECIEAARSLRSQGVRVTYVSCRATTTYDVEVESGLRLISLGLEPPLAADRVIDTLRRLEPSHLLAHLPLTDVIAWATAQQRLRTACMFAESFPGTGLRRLRAARSRARLRTVLNDARLEWAGNHCRPASRQLAGLGVNPHKVIPYDFRHPNDPQMFSTRSGRSEGSRELFYVGGLAPGKGVEDLVGAVALLRHRGMDVTARIAGGDEREIAAIKGSAERAGAGPAVELLGTVDNASVVPLMRQADAVVVPSRYEYPEAFPLTIFEGLASRTPLVVSDHPVFREHLVDGRSAVVFRAGDATSLADAVERLFRDPTLYGALSAAAPETWGSLEVSANWSELIERWVRDRPEDREWIASCSLAGR